MVNAPRRRPGRPPKQHRAYPNRLREVREARGLSLEQVAPAIGVTAGALGRWETDDRGLRVATLERLAAYYGIPAADLLNTGDPAKGVRERTLLAIFRRMRGADQERLLRLATALASDKQEAAAG